MAEGTGLTASDVALMTRNNDTGFGQNWIWIIGLLIVAGIFGNGFGFGGNTGTIAAVNTGVTEEYIANQFNSRDVWNTNQTVNSTASATQVEILNNRANCNNNFSNLRYDTAIGQANLQKDILLGNQTMQAQMAQCCCDIKSLVRDEVQGVKDLINNNTIQDLRDQLNVATNATANAVQTQNILGSIGRFYLNTPVNPYYAYSGVYGTSIS